MDQEQFEIEIKKEFLSEAQEMLEEAESAFLDLEKDPEESSILDRIFRLAHTIKGSAYAAGFNELAEFGHVFETLLGQLRNHELQIDGAVIDILLKSNDRLVHFVEDLAEDYSCHIDTATAISDLQGFLEGKGKATKPADGVQYKKADGLQQAASKEQKSENSSSGIEGLHLFDDEPSESQEEVSQSEPVDPSKEMSEGVGAEKSDGASRFDTPLSWEGERGRNKAQATPSVSPKSQETQAQKVFDIDPGKADPIGYLEQNQGRKILVVDDEEDITEILTLILKSLGHQVLVANSGREGLELVAAGGIDAIISDIRMPQMTGTEFIQKVREKDENVPVIFITGVASRAEVIDCLNLGAFSLIEKPFEESAIISNLTNALRVKDVFEAVVKLSSLNFKAYMTSSKIARLTMLPASEIRDKDLGQSRQQLDQILEQIARLTNLVLKKRLGKDMDKKAEQAS